ncbi:MAG: plastocyanin/azurin family copper-binding protein [Candidatus Eremiobacteraeota bacterium]|nr:plastocyanin/azurin family copper-binding protein [Candidatus Eremiobacteraeota bacterium]
MTLAAGMLAACTPGAPSAPSVVSARSANAVVVGVSLVKYGQMSSAYGMVGGFNPTLVVVAHGVTIQFHNEDSFNHTATSIAGSTFPGGNPIPSSALSQSGSDVSQPDWSSGLLTGQSFSRTFSTAAVGQYLFGCFYHYPTMRGVIIVQ